MQIYLQKILMKHILLISTMNNFYSVLSASIGFILAAL